MSRLLICESDEVLTECYRDFLVAHGFTVSTANGGIQCVALLKLAVDDLLVLDLDVLWGGADGVVEWIEEQSSSSGDSDCAHRAARLVAPAYEAHATAGNPAARKTVRIARPVRQHSIGPAMAAEGRAAGDRPFSRRAMLYSLNRDR